MIELINVKKTYKAKKSKDTIALDDVSFKIPSKGLYFITGESGSGKSTLLNVLGGLDKIDSGSIKVGNIDLAKLSKENLVKYRNTCVGFVFQDYNLFLEYNVYDNVKLALELSNQNNDSDIDDILKRVGLYDLRLRNINELSGGQRQRVAIARALIKNPEIILADEPTGNLDSATSRQIMELLKDISQKKCVVVVTHDRTLVNEFGNGFILMQDGKVINDMIVALKNDDKEITLRNSNFKNKYALKFMFHNIKSRSGRFGLTIILTAFALTLVCLMFTFLFYNDATYTAKVLSKHNVNKVGIEKSNCIASDDYVDCYQQNWLSSDSEVNLGSPSYSISELQFRFGIPDDDKKISVGLDNIVEIKNDNILSLFMGRLPSTDSEIVIDKNLAYDILKYGIYNSNNELVKPESFKDILNLRVSLGTYPVTIVGINEFNSDSDFAELHKTDRVLEELERNFANFTEDNNIYVKGFVENKELLYSENEMLDKYRLMIKDDVNFVGYIENKTYYTEDISYYDMNFNLVNKEIGPNEVIVSASDILNTHSTLGDLTKLFSNYQQNNKDLDYETAIFNFLKDILTNNPDVLDVMLYNYNDILANDYTKLKIVGISFDNNTYLSKDIYRSTNHSKKKINKIYLGFANKEELNALVKKYKYPSNIYNVGKYTTLVSDLGEDIASINTFYHYIRPYLNIVSLIFLLFASLLIFNFISVTISYAKKNIGILKSLGAKDKDIYKIFGYEAIAIAVLAFVLSIPMWSGACSLSNKLFFSDQAYVGGLEINVLAPLSTFTLSLLLSWLISIMCCNKINKMQPIDAILNK